MQCHLMKTAISIFANLCLAMNLQASRVGNDTYNHVITHFQSWYDDAEAEVLN